MMKTVRRAALSSIVAVLIAAGPARLTAQPGAPSPFANETYAWWGEIVSADATTMTVRVPTMTPVTSYIGQFKPGDRIVLTWRPGTKGQADAVFLVAKLEVMQSSKVDVGYILPSEFVSADPAGKTLTIKVPLPGSALSAARAAQGKTVKVTTPMTQPKATAAVESIEVSERPKFDPPKDWTPQPPKG
jgi:hypothetical protein